MLTQTSEILSESKIKPFLYGNYNDRKNLKLNSKSLSVLPKIKVLISSNAIRSPNNKNIKRHKKCLTESTTLISKHSLNISITQQNLNKKIKSTDQKVQNCEQKITINQNKYKIKNTPRDVPQFNSILLYYFNLWQQVSQSNKKQIKKQMCQFIKRLKYSQVLLNLWKQSIKQKDISTLYTIQIIENLLKQNPKLLQQMTKIGNMMLHVISSNKKNRWYELKSKIRQAQIKKDRTIQDIATNLKKAEVNTRYNIVKSIQSIDWNLKAQSIRYQSWMQSAIKHFRQNGVKCELLKGQIYNYY